MTLFRKRPMCWLAIGFLLILCLILQGRSYKEALDMQESEAVLIEGKVRDKEYKTSAYGSYWQLTLSRVYVLQEEKGAKTETVLTQKLDGNYFCRIPVKEKDTLEIKIGQRILLSGKPVSWEEARNPGQFNSAKYYISQGILGQFHKCSVIRQGEEPFSLREKLWQLRTEAGELLVRELGEEDGSLICAMLLGDKSELKQEDKSLYQRNGISHVLAISGLHLSLLGMGLLRFLRKVLPGNNSASLVCIIVMSLYCVFTGSSISTIRATLMFSLSLAAGMLGRSYDSLSALGLAAILQLFKNPYVVNNSGFQLSFLAVIGVTFLNPALQTLLGAKGKIIKALCVSLSASLATLPVLLTNYGVFQWYSVFLNLCILPFMSVLLFLAVLFLLLELWLVPGAAYVGKTVFSLAGLESCEGFGGLECVLELIKEGFIGGMRLILWYFDLCCRLFEKAFRVDGYLGAPKWPVIVIYAVLVLIALSRLVKHSPIAGKMLLLCAVSILTLHLNYGAEITMLDVGQGDCIIIRNSNGKVYLCDCGSSSVNQVGKYRLLPFLKYKGYGKIEGIFFSHFDQDHINGLLELLEAAEEEKIEIQYLFLPVSVSYIEEDGEILDKLQLLAGKQGIEIVFLEQGDRIRDQNMEFLCLHPKGKDAAFSQTEDRNEQSMVIALTYENLELLLTGDVGEAGEKEIVNYLDLISQNETKKECGDTVLKNENKKVVVLKVAHHGSSGSNSSRFLEAAEPQLSLISCGRNNSYGHPHKETLERLQKTGSRILSTANDGAIRVYVRKGKVYVTAFG